MDWDRRHSALLYQFLSGGQLVYRDKLHYEALIRAKHSPNALERTQQQQQNGAKERSTTQAGHDVSARTDGDTHLRSHHHRGHQRRPSASMGTVGAGGAIDGPAKDEVLRDRQMEARLLAIKLCWEVIAWSNEGWVWVALSPLFLILSFVYLDPTTIIKVKCLYIMLLIDILLAGGIKYATKRTRPSYNRGGLFVGPDIFSFPSGHSSRAMLLVHVSIFVFGWRTLWSSIAVLCWATLVAISRLALGRHFLTDVMGGLTLGALEFWASFSVLQHFVFSV